MWSQVDELWDDGFALFCLTFAPEGVTFRVFKSFHTFVLAESSPEDEAEKNRLCWQADRAAKVKAVTWPGSVSLYVHECVYVQACITQTRGL